jgi:Pre-toxin TG
MQPRQFVSRRMTRRFVRAIPFLGGAVAIGYLASAVRRKGWQGGIVDTLLEITPFVGTAKNAVELGRGRDLIPEKNHLRTTGH